MFCCYYCKAEVKCANNICRCAVYVQWAEAEKNLSLYEEELAAKYKDLSLKEMEDNMTPQELNKLEWLENAKENAQYAGRLKRERTREQLEGIRFCPKCGEEERDCWWCD